MIGYTKSSRKILMPKSTIKDKRRLRRNNSKITSTDELYNSLSDDEVFELPEETPEYVKEIQVKTVERKRFRPLIGAEYDYETMSIKYSEKNVAEEQ